MRLSILATVFSAVSAVAVPSFSLSNRGSQFSITDAQKIVDDLNTVLLGHQKNIQDAVASITPTSTQVEKVAVQQKVNTESTAMSSAVASTYKDLALKAKGVAPKQASKANLASFAKSINGTSTIVSNTASISAVPIDPITCKLDI